MILVSIMIYLILIINIIILIRYIYIYTYDIDNQYLGSQMVTILPQNLCPMVSLASHDSPSRQVQGSEASVGLSVDVGPQG